MAKEAERVFEEQTTAAGVCQQADMRIFSRCFKDQSHTSVRLFDVYVTVGQRSSRVHFHSLEHSSSKVLPAIV